LDIDGEAAGDRFGESVALSSDGTILAIGGTLNDGTGTDAGHVRVLEWSSSAWTQLGLDIDGEAAGDQFGESVALSSDGTIVAIGGPSNDGTGTDAGNVVVKTGTRLVSALLVSASSRSAHTAHICMFAFSQVPSASALVQMARRPCPSVQEQRFVKPIA
jgi:hypothetical protein